MSINEGYTIVLLGRLTTTVLVISKTRKLISRDVVAHPMAMFL